MNYIPYYLTTAGDVAQPDPVDSESLYPKDDHVMSRTINGEVLSTYGDNTWDYTMFPGRKRFVLDRVFDNHEKNSKYLNDLKYILFRIIFSPWCNSTNTVDFHLTSLKRLIRMSESYGLPLKKAIRNTSIFDQILDDSELTKEQIGRRLSSLRNLLNVLHDMACAYDDFPFPPSNQVHEYLEKLCEEYPANSQQTPVIPARILSRRIATCFNYIDTFLGMKHLFVKLFDARIKAERKWKKVAAESEPQLGQISARITRDFYSELNKQKYDQFREYFGVTDFQTLKAVVKKVRLPMIEMIHAFSGMRSQEAAALSMGGFQLRQLDRTTVPVLRSYTTKMAKDAGYFADWVTSPEIEKVFEAGRILNECVLRYEYKEDLHNLKEADVPLFISVNFKKTNAGSGGLYNFPVQKMSFRHPEHPLNQDPEMVVNESDIAEILAIDSFADTDSLGSGIQVGTPFGFRSHMYRRSLAVYTARSGLVSLPTLKKQLKHMAIQTSAFYGNDAAFAKNMILPKSENEAFDSAVISQRGFIKEFQEESAEGQADLLYSEVVTADQIVFGGMGTQIQKQKNSGTLPTVLTDREKTKKAVRQGRLRYAETPLAGCMAVEVCDRIAFSSITTCIGCGDSVFNNRSVDLLEKTKMEYQERLDKFGKGTPYGMQLERDIRDMDSALRMREKLIATVDITDGKA